MKPRCAGLLALIAAASFAACVPTKSNSQSPRTAGSGEMAADAGLPTPKPSSKRGVIVPSDTGIGAGPPGTPNNTGTSSKTPGPSMGN